MPLDFSYKLKNFRNRVDFFLRSRLSFSRKIPPRFETPARDKKLQLEIREFLKLFDWRRHLIRYEKGRSLVACDIGARNFAFAPEIDHIFKGLGLRVTLHGIEIDAHRMLIDFRSRRSYGDYYAASIRDGRFHAIDYLTFHAPLDVAFLLNPFVSSEPTIDWGLPVSTLKPEKMVRHTFELLSPSEGVMLLSSPSPEEYEISFGLAEKVGFIVKEEKQWTPPRNSVQQKPRYGAIFISKVS